MDINNIVTSDWQMSVTGFGKIAQGAAAINECINAILSTQKGSDPINPDFGVDLLSWIDKPSNVMAPGLVREIIEQVGDYETRIDLTTVNYQYPDGTNNDLNGRVVFSLTWRYKDGVLPQGGDVIAANNTVYFLLGDQNGFVLISDYNVSILVK